MPFYKFATPGRWIVDEEEASLIGASRPEALDSFAAVGPAEGEGWDTSAKVLLAWLAFNRAASVRGGYRVE